MLINQLKKRSARDRTRFGQDHLSQNVAELAKAAGRNQLKGKILTKEAPKKFSTVKAKIVMFHATTVRSPPLLDQKIFVTEW